MKTSWISTTVLTTNFALLLSLGTVHAGDNGPSLQGLLSSSGSAHGFSDSRTFSLVPNNVGAKRFEDCFAAYPGDPTRRPTATVTVLKDVAAGPNDLGLVELRNFKPGLAFDLFTVEHSRFGANGQPVANFDGFGLAWYQSDIEVNDKGRAAALIKTILLDQIFGFLDSKSDPTRLPPTNTFHIGFWFNNPHDAQTCGFDPTKPTPFNGEHQAGPLAMISLPNATTGLGPLCLHPDPSQPSGCNP